MTGTQHSPARAPLRVGIIGAGRVGSALANLAHDAGCDVATWTRSRGDADEFAALVTSSDVVIIAVVDSAIADVANDVAAALKPAQPLASTLVLATSGSRPIDDLASIAALGHDVARMHPVRSITFETTPQQLAGTRAACTAETARALQRATAFARSLGFAPLVIDAEHAAVWHAATSIAGNFPVTLIAMASDLAQVAGVDEADALQIMTTLAAGAIEQAAATSPGHALTGPIVRGDDATVDVHRVTIAEHAPELADVYDALAAQTRQLALRAGRLPEQVTAP